MAKKSKTAAKKTSARKAAKKTSPSSSKKAKTPRAKSAGRRTPKKTTSKKKASPTKKAAGKTSARPSSNGAPDLPSPVVVAGGMWCEPKVLESPGFSGKPEKLTRDTYPEDAAAADFLCFGPPAVDDGQFEEARICDMGCFHQDGKDSNKFYHGAVVQHRTSQNWYAYFEWGRTGGRTSSFQFVACATEADARTCFAKQLHQKNDKRGEWVTVSGLRTLRAKKGKDCYLVRPMATRSTGLPDAQNVKLNEGSKARRNGSAESDGDPRTLKVLRDLRLATIHFTKKSMADESIPTQSSVDEARAILGEALNRLLDVGDDLEEQVHDRELAQLTNLLYSRIPRRKRINAPVETWVLSRENVQRWSDDLDAFESALQAVDLELHPNLDILAEMDITMQWLAPDSPAGKFVRGWLPGSTRKEHEAIDGMEIKHVWSVERHADRGDLKKAHKRILRGKVDRRQRPRDQPRTRLDLPKEERKAFKDSNTALLFHGTRGVNVYSILLESLRMPESLVAVPLTGAKFGPGLYFSDDWKKSADYTNAAGSREAGTHGAVKGRSAFMFVADVVLGTAHVPDDLKVFTKPPRGHHSVYGKAGKSGVDDNEFVVYRTDQACMRYLVEFEAA